MRPIGKTKSLLTTSLWHLCHCLHCRRLKFVLGIPKTSMDKFFIGTYSYKLGTGTPTFGTRFRHICTIFYQVPPLWYHGTTTLSPPPPPLVSCLLVFSYSCICLLGLSATTQTTVLVFLSLLLLLLLMVS